MFGPVSHGVLRLRLDAEPRERRVDAHDTAAPQRDVQAAGVPDGVLGVVIEAAVRKDERKDALKISRRARAGAGAAIAPRTLNCDPLLSGSPRARHASGPERD